MDDAAAWRELLNEMTPAELRVLAQVLDDALDESLGPFRYCRLASLSTDALLDLRIGLRDRLQPIR